MAVWFLLPVFYAIGLGVPPGIAAASDGTCTDSSTTLLQSGKQVKGQVGTMKEKCSAEFFLNPKDTDPKTFLEQFKPCGWYKQHCETMFDTWFEEEGGYNADNVIKADVTYPRHLDSGVHLVEFDIGLDKATYDAYVAIEDESKSTLLDDIDGTGERSYLNFTNYVKYGRWKTKAIFHGATWEFGEHCVETFAKSRDDWGRVGTLGTFWKTYNDMGNCGSGRLGFWRARDCMKHDVCSYFKSLALNEESDGFCKDIDCGDEAAQAICECWIRKQEEPDEAVICSKSRDDTDPNFYSTLDVVFDIDARIIGKKQACTLRTKWERNQGMPWQRLEDGMPCTSPDDCISRRCDRKSVWSFEIVCQPRLGIGERCNENTDCISFKCGWSRWSRKCLENE